jgi:branched-chain amino acid transport system ATP-binding protein
VPLLELSGVTMRFGGLVAVNDLHLALDAGRLYGLIGPNGAGKTTVFNVITGVYTPTQGEIRFDGAEIAGERTGRITRRGVARTFQNIRLFGDMTVLDNVKVAFHCRQEAGLAAAVLRAPKHSSEEERVDRESRELLKIFHLEAAAEERARNLPYGSQRRLEIARAMATLPRLLLLDEPAAGMNPHEAKEPRDLIRWVRDRLAWRSLWSSQHEGRHGSQIAPCSTASTIAIGKPAEIQSNRRSSRPTRRRVSGERQRRAGPGVRPVCSTARSKP